MEVNNLPEEMRNAAKYLARVMAPLLPDGRVTEEVRLMRAAADEIELLRAIVGKLPMTADGVPIIPCNWVWTLFSDGCVAGPYMVLDINCRKDYPINLSLGEFQTKQLFSTREAAEAAREK